MSTATSPPPNSGVGVLDKTSTLLGVVARRPATLSEMVTRSGLSRPTVHRLARALERLGLFSRDEAGRFALGPRLGSLAVEAHRDRLPRLAEPMLAELAGHTGLDARLVRRRGDLNVCVASSERGRPETPRVPPGTARSLRAGPAAQVLLAWEEPDELYEGLRGARFTAAQLARVRGRGWANGPDPLVPAASSVAAPVWSRAAGGRVVAAVVVSGTAVEVPASPARALTRAVIDTAARIGDALVGSYPGETATA
ncbi:IclR family transcriptional regulator [Streptomyces profundus]|uniref:IclR family transcriptional regulator n=1 Tax=Streptomyces profundus TaxID=2867410 RepID=UPI001D16F4B1|nr:helix-turn-helix domain-containing protein [Streptomyces sp. MA3_2.13]UED87036.1 helix-turn-helix domain-containing protein [Streptomyces sp. MA3_2.13]